MADIIGSSKRNGKALMADFKTAVAHINKIGKQHILSPATITLGDEFQGVVKNPHSALRVIFDMEKYLMSLRKPFRLRYVIHEGDIQTSLNKKTAYEMLGPGLTEARRQLTGMKSAKTRFKVSLSDKELTEKLNLMFVILQGIIGQWTPAQQKVVAAFLELGDYRKVAQRLNKDTTAIWRRKGSLMIEEFNSLKKLMLKATNPKWKP
jgi:SatD family (SatD)